MPPHNRDVLKSYLGRLNAAVMAAVLAACAPAVSVQEPGQPSYTTRERSNGKELHPSLSKDTALALFRQACLANKGRVYEARYVAERSGLFPDQPHVANLASTNGAITIFQNRETGLYLGFARGNLIGESCTVAYAGTSWTLNP